MMEDPLRQGQLPWVSQGGMIKTNILSEPRMANWVGLLLLPLSALYQIKLNEEGKLKQTKDDKKKRKKRRKKEKKINESENCE